MNLRVVTARVFLKTVCVMVLMTAGMVAKKPQTVEPDAVSITIENCGFGRVMFREFWEFLLLSSNNLRHNMN